MFFLKLLSLLPLSLLYILSDFLYFFARYILRYRKKVILSNLEKAFPEKTDEERKKIVSAFYRNLSDLVVETIKILSLSEEELRRHVKAPEESIPFRLLSEGKPVIVLAGHLCNWEWLLAACMVHYKLPIDAVYKPLNSKFSDRLMLQIRSHFGATPLAMKDVLRDQVKKKNIPHTLAMVADQTPLKSEIQFWTCFLNQETPFYVGADKISTMLRMPVIFVGMKRLRRGQYEIYFKEIHPDPADQEFPYTRKYAEILESEIRQQPANWLWSHRRWKHTKF